MVQPEFEEVFRTDFRLKGRWREDFFGNPNPVVLELGCGRGEYTVSLAERYPDKNFIGVDIKGARMWRGAKTATEQEMRNAGFLRTRIEFIDSCFAPGEVDEIWITFPRPAAAQGACEETPHRTGIPYPLRPLPAPGRTDPPQKRLPAPARLHA